MAIRTEREIAVAQQLQKALWRAEHAAVKKAAAYEHLVKAAMLVRKRLGNTLALGDKRGPGGREKRKRAKMTVAVPCRALDRLGR
jgi:hypothetical protein